MRPIRIFTTFAVITATTVAIRFDYLKSEIRPQDQITAQSGHSAAHGVGSNEDYYKKNGYKNNKGYTSEHYVDKAKHGDNSGEHKKGQNHEKGGHVKSNSNHANNYSNHHEAKKSHKGAKFGEKKGHKKGHKTKGYHNKFFKDEYHKEHKFYDDAHKSGEFSKYGDAHSNFHNQEGAHKKANNHNAGFHRDKYGKKDYTAKGHNLQDHSGHSFHKGDEVYHDHSTAHGSKAAGSRGKHYGHH